MMGSPERLFLLLILSVAKFMFCSNRAFFALLQTSFDRNIGFDRQQVVNYDEVVCLIGKLRACPEAKMTKLLSGT